MIRIRTILSLIVVLSVFATPALALDKKHAAKAQAAIKKGLDYLRKSQAEDGSWSPKYGPAITGLAISAFGRQPDASRKDPTIANGITYIKKFVKPDGAIYDRILSNYNTSLSLMGLGQFAGDKDIAPIVLAAQKSVISKQWQEGMKDPKGNPITKDHPFYGGSGYGRHGRPDMNNTTIMLEALYDSGMDCNDPAFKRALIYIQRCQGAATNDMFNETVIEQDGGFIYATSINKDHIGLPQTRTDDAVAKRDIAAGKVVSPLSSYGSITYAGFKSYLYAQLERDDPRVKAVWEWIANNYTLEQNPRMPEPNKYQSYHYYLYVFARAMNAAGKPQVTLASGEKRDWANDVISTLVELQRPDGSFVNTRADRWGEGDANLVTSYGVIALQNALGLR